MPPPAQRREQRGDGAETERFRGGTGARNIQIKHIINVEYSHPPARLRPGTFAQIDEYFDVIMLSLCYLFDIREERLLSFNFKSDSMLRHIHF